MGEGSCFGPPFTTITSLVHFAWKMGVKMTSQVYIDLLKDKFMPYFNVIPFVKRNSLIFMQDNAPSHALMMTKDFLSSIGFSGSRLMAWPASSPDLNPIENYWAVFKSKLYTHNKQYSNKNDL